ncbi:aminotransferase class I/II-fold pyridoxal phosphate-dependent enzyme [Mangrovactinospora gilvigrisea]|uniref:aminotransferase class I/II-fold pyridoxal phosphate-dependent enzyme n=1 Tax=Mangrovactinospora gilvigrisea TaxID=1428644 RepID=UPI000A4CB8C2|nr:aminotransferase class I/II-fold pyridoxal phosphate-dependent enzyme [Mangrovactinospora gilvigrisea]
MTTRTPTPADLPAAQTAFRALVDRGLKLDLTRGKPAADQLDLSNDLLGFPGRATFSDAAGTDLRNYGGPAGLPELRALFAPFLQVPADRLLALGNSSLTVMHDTVVHALLSEIPGAKRRWVEEQADTGIAFLCPVPGYDRHFSICERFGIDMIPVPMTPDGPDMDVVERLAASEPRIKGIWCVPKYSNPDGAVYSDATVRRLAEMPTAAPDFRIFWDNAYAVHHLTEEEVEIADILAECEAAGHADRAFVFGSTSKVTFASAGVAFFGSSRANVEWLQSKLAKSTIGPDKVNQLRHVIFLRDGDGLRALMARHRALLAPKFEAVDRILTERLGASGEGPGEWTNPKGGYFISLRVPEGCAARVVALAKEAGIALTPAGATHPYGQDPEDRTIRLAPTFATLADVEAAVDGVATCVQLAAAEKAV